MGAIKHGLMRGAVVLVAVLLVAGTGPTLAAGNEVPLSDAGLDQRVQLGDTVLLDGAGSRDPDGTIAEVAWRIRSPNGSVIAPACETCEWTWFAPMEVGTYNVTLRVTDDAGTTSEDTLFVQVGPDPAPTVELTGPTTTTVGEEETYVATASVATGTLSRLVWTIEDVPVASTSVQSPEVTDELERSFPSPGPIEVTVVAYNDDGQRSSDELTVSVRDPGAPPDDEASPGSAATTPSGGDITHAGSSTAHRPKGQFLPALPRSSAPGTAADEPPSRVHPGPAATETETPAPSATTNTTTIRTVPRLGGTGTAYYYEGGEVQTDSDKGFREAIVEFLT